MRRSILVILPIAALIVTSGCAQRRAAGPPPVAARVPERLDGVEALLDRGCYTCLEQVYEDALTRQAPHLAFEAASLLVLRSKELGLSHAIWTDRARALAASDPERTAFLGMIDAVPVDPLNGDREGALMLGPVRTRARTQLPIWRELLHTSRASGAFRSYVELSLLCTLDFGDTTQKDLDGLVSTLADAPILQYRAGICRSTEAARLQALRDGNPDYVDADYVLGKYELQRNDQEAAMGRFRAAAAAFPESPAIATTIGNLYQSWEDWSAALTAFDAALAIVPDHPDALLGRTMALSNLSRHEEAIAAATQLIDARWFAGQAFYWRAWNQLQLQRLELARADADNALRTMVNAGVYLLSGVIDWRLRRLDTAERDLQNALTMDFGQCDAALYLGGVRAARVKYPEALAAFQQARQCYDLAIAVRRGAIEKIAAAPGSAARKARQIASQERAIRDNERRREDAITAVSELEKSIRTTPAPPRSESK